MVRFCIYPYVLGVSQSIELILNSAKWSHHKKIQYGLQDGCCSEYYSEPVHSYPREIMLVYIPKYSAADNGFWQGRAWGECALHLWAVNQLMPYFYAAIHWDNIYEVGLWSWSRGNSWYYACWTSVLFAAGHWTSIFVRDWQRTLPTWKRPPYSK